MEQVQDEQVRAVLLDFPQVAAMTALSVKTIRRWSAVGEHEFPRPVRLGRLLRFKSEDVERWVREVKYA